MSSNTSEEKLRTMESYKRLINLGLSAVCLAMEIAIFAYNWMYFFRFEIMSLDRKFYIKGHLLELAIYGVILFLFSMMYGGMPYGLSEECGDYFLAGVRNYHGEYPHLCGAVRYGIPSVCTG